MAPIREPGSDIRCPIPEPVTVAGGLTPEACERRFSTGDSEAITLSPLMDTHSIVPLVLITLSSAVLVVPLFQRAGFGSVLGYLLIGSVLGPNGMGIFYDVPSVMRFAELGVVFLLFVIGLELKPNRLWAMRHSVFGLGAAQVLLTAVVFAGVARAFGTTWAQAAVVGGALSLSSTALSLQVLAERNQLNTSFGRSAFGILLFQDLAAIPLLTILPLLSPVSTGNDFDLHKAAIPVGVTVAMVVVGRFALRPWFRFAAGAKAREVFTAAALLIVLGAAVLMEHLGLSMALGTFLAGILLSDSEYRHELETDIEPFKGLLLGLFFMAVGMSVDYGFLFSRPAEIVGVTLGWMLAKFLLLYAIARGAKQSNGSAAALAQVLCMGGEFAFVVFGAAEKAQVLSPALAQTLTLSVTLSMMLTPVLYFMRDRMLCTLRKRANNKFDSLPTAHPQVILAGFGRVGQIVGRLLRIYDIPFVALELDPAQVDLVRRFGGEIYYGDASRVDLLERAGASTAKLFVLAIDDVDVSVQVAKMVKEKFPHLKILARARNRTHVFELFALGIEHVFRETLGSSLEMGEATLVQLGFEKDRAAEILRKFRAHDEKTLEAQRSLMGDEKAMIQVAKQSVQQLADLLRADVPEK